MSKTIVLGIWNKAPFRGSIFKCVDDLNKFLKENDFTIQYDIMQIDPDKLDSSILPDVFILDGGEDIDPARYGERNISSYFSKVRDDIEFKLTKFMHGYKVRLSGICRGHQLLNVFFGGNLFQDIHHQKCVPEGLNHHSGHKVKTIGSKKKLALYNFVGDYPFSVSSLHHQAVRYPPKNFYNSLVWRVRKNNKMGNVIEGIEKYNGTVRGLQCHPEFRGYPKDGLLFAYLMHIDNFITDEAMQINNELVEERFKSLIHEKKVKNYTRSPRISSSIIREAPQRISRRLNYDELREERLRRR